MNNRTTTKLGNGATSFDCNLRNLTASAENDNYKASPYSATAANSESASCAELVVDAPLGLPLCPEDDDAVAGAVEEDEPDTALPVDDVALTGMTVPVLLLPAAAAAAGTG